MSTELKIIDSSVLSEAERTELNANIDSLIAAHKGNRQEINRLVFESVAAMTAGEDYERQLANKKGPRRFLGDITGSNKKLQDKINSSRAAAQYASQQTLQRLAEQNLMTFDLIAAVNNKLNASVLSIEGEINQIYSALVTFFKQSRSDMIQLESRVERLEKNVNLLNWQNAIEYQMFNGVEYTDLDDPAKIVCLVRDFYNITKGEWTTSDLLLLKTAMSTIDLSPKKSIDYFDFIKAVAYDGRLSQYLLAGKQIAQQPEPYLVPLLGMNKLALLDGEERFVVDTIVESLAENGVAANRQNLSERAAKKYLMQEAQVNTEVQVNCYDLIMEMLFNLREAEDAGILLLPEESEALDTAAGLERDYQKAAELFKNCQLKEAHPLLVRLSEQGYARANALLFWLYSDGCREIPIDDKIANEYATKGFQAGDAICSLQYALFVTQSEEEKISICEKYKPLVQEMTDSGDVFAVYMMGSCYCNKTDEQQDHLYALQKYIDAASCNFYRAFNSIVALYCMDNSPVGDLQVAMIWAKKAQQFSENMQAISCTANVLHNMKKYSEAMELYQEYMKMGGTPYYPIGYMYMKGEGVEKNCSLALQYFEKGIALNSTYCYINAGCIYINGDGVDANPEKAAEYFQKAAELGDACGQCNIGYCYLLGDGVPVDKERAKYWFGKSAAQNYQQAIDALKENFG